MRLDAWEGGDAEKGTEDERLASLLGAASGSGRTLSVSVQLRGRFTEGAGCFQTCQRPGPARWPAGGWAALREVMGSWIQTSGSFRRRPWTPAHLSSGAAAIVAASCCSRSVTPRCSAGTPTLQLTPSASCVRAPSRWDLLLPESQPRAVGNVALGSPEDWLAGAAGIKSRVLGGLNIKSSWSHDRGGWQSNPEAPVTPESYEGGRVPPPASGGLPAVFSDPLLAEASSRGLPSSPRGVLPVRVPVSVSEPSLFTCMLSYSMRAHPKDLTVTNCICEGVVPKQAGIPRYGGCNVNT